MSLRAPSSAFLAVILVLASWRAADSASDSAFMHIGDMVALKALSTTPAALIRDGYFQPGDGGEARFTYDRSPCPSVSAIFVPAKAGGCWHIERDRALDVRAFGARCDARRTGDDWSVGTDDAIAFNAAFSLGAPVRLPANRGCYVNATIVDESRFGDIGGEGVGLSTIIGGPGANPILRFGDSTTTINRTRLHDLTLTRNDCGAPTSVGIEWKSFNYAMERDVDVQCNDVNRVVTGPHVGALSVEYAGDHIFSSNARSAYFRMDDAAGVTLINPEFGLNGGERFSVACQLEITGNANALELVGGTLIAQGPPGAAQHPISRSDVLCFHHSTNPATVVKFIGVNAENYGAVISSDSHTQIIGELGITGGRFGGSAATQFFALDPVTKIGSFQGDGFETGSAMTLGSAATSYGRWSSLTGVIVGGSFTLFGAPRGSGPDFSVVGGSFLSNVILRGNFSRLLFVSQVEGQLVDMSMALKKSILSR